MIKKHPVRFIVLAMLLGSVTLWGTEYLQQLYIGSTPLPDQVASLWVDGETVLRRYGEGPDGHPGTPLGIRREGMPPGAQVATVMNLAMTTCKPEEPCVEPDPYFGPAIGFQVSGPGAVETSIGGIAAVQMEDGRVAFVFWGRTAAGGYEVFGTLDESGFAVYDGPGWFPTLPPVTATLP